MSAQQPSRIASVEPGPVRSGRTVLRLWGDEIAGRVNDWVYVSSERLYQIVFSMSPGASFGHSERNRTIFGGDELYYVLAGTILLANPETGELERLGPGEAAWFHPDTWHHAFAQGLDEVRVLEFFAPPPAAGMSQDYARTRPYLSSPRYTDDQWLGRWPEAGRRRQNLATLHRVRPEQTLWRLEGNDQRVLVGLMLSTPKLTVGCGELFPGQMSDVRVHPGDLGLYVREGRLSTLLPDGEPGNDWFHLGPDDGFFVPAGVPYRFANVSDEPARFTFGVAPGYPPPSSHENVR